MPKCPPEVRQKRSYVSDSTLLHNRHCPSKEWPSLPDAKQTFRWRWVSLISMLWDALNVAIVSTENWVSDTFLQCPLPYTGGGGGGWNSHWAELSREGKSSLYRFGTCLTLTSKNKTVCFKMFLISVDYLRATWLATTHLHNTIMTSGMDHVLRCHACHITYSCAVARTTIDPLYHWCKKVVRTNFDNSAKYLWTVWTLVVWFVSTTQVNHNHNKLSHGNNSLFMYYTWKW